MKPSTCVLLTVVLLSGSSCDETKAEASKASPAAAQPEVKAAAIAPAPASGTMELALTFLGDENENYVATVPTGSKIHDTMNVVILPDGGELGFVTEKDHPTASSLAKSMADSRENLDVQATADDEVRWKTGPEGGPFEWRFTVLVKADDVYACSQDGLKSQAEVDRAVAICRSVRAK